MSEDDIKALQNRITAFALLGILLTGLVVGVSAVLPQYGQARQRAEEAFRFSARVQALAVSQLLGKWRDVAMQITSRTRIRDKLEDYNRGELPLEELQAFTGSKLLDAISQSAAAVGVSRLDAVGRPVVNVGATVPRSLLSIPGPGTAELSEAGPFTVNDEEYLLISAPILNRAGERVGTDVVLFRTAPLRSMLSANDGQRPSVSYLARGERVIAADSGAAAAAPLALMARVRPGGEPLLESDSRDSVAVAVAVPGSDWVLAVTTPSAALYASAGEAMVMPLVSISLMVLIGVVGTGRVIRPLARRAVGHASELAAAATEQRLALENASDFVYRHDPAGRYTYVSPAVERITGFTPSLWISRRMSLSPLSGVRGGEAHGTYQIDFEHRDGYPIVLEVSERPYQENGRFAGVVGIARNVTERVAAERALKRSVTEWNFAMDFFDDAIFIVDLEDRVLRANRAFFSLTGVSATEALGRNLTELMHPDGGGQSCPVCRARRERQEVRLTLEPEQSPVGRPVEVSVKVLRDEHGQPAAVLSTAHDLTHSRRTEQERMLAASVFEGSHEAIVIADAQRQILRVNRAFARLTGLDGESVRGLRVDQMLSARGEFAPEVWDGVAAEGHFQGEASYRRYDGEVFPVWHRLSAQHDSRGRLLHYIVTFNDITEKKLSEQRINHLAYYDVLTELPNRALYAERLEHALERVQRQSHQLAVLFLDVDRFKNVNDSLGHQYGDQLLQSVAERLRTCVRRDDTVARLGGDEFGVILEDIEGLAEVEVIARKMLEALNRPVELGGTELFVGGSIGISLYPEDGSTADVLLQHADTAMYRAKERGRNTYEFYTPELTRITSERLKLENDLRRAVERNELVVYYQPQAAVEDGRIIGAEALVRWEKPAFGLVPPGAFIPLAEETGLIEPIGRQVLLAACLQVRAWQDAGLAALRIAVNVAGYQILQGDIVGAVRDALAQSGISPSQLELEITEGFVMSRPGDGIETLHRLKALGVTLAIDDFGTGYSSLGYLKSLPIDRLKIDRSFIRDIPRDRDDTAIASTIIAMARHLGLEVIAEGVEEEAQIAFLANERCDEYQGFHLSPPVPAAQFEKLLRGRVDLKRSGAR